jgi:hypothetical protein
MEMPMLFLDTPVGVIVVLRVGLPVVHVTLGIVIEFQERALILEAFPHDIHFRLAQHPVAFLDLFPGRQQ